MFQFFDFKIKKVLTQFVKAITISLVPKNNNLSFGFDKKVDFIVCVAIFYSQKIHQVKKKNQ
ncbi:hypothetical protein F5ESL0247_06735 [Lactobacillus sp. ESL0247]|nr:hypothetical protein F5ESL0247_06735 [Lactobacillus sp. ESL0247]RMC27409.1 hypothetical protein F5ESL0246_06735 [Lactobacillus sp. ESL0246]